VAAIITCQQWLAATIINFNDLQTRFEAIGKERRRGGGESHTRGIFMVITIAYRGRVWLE
jgi:hypothetical protein